MASLTVRLLGDFSVLVGETPLHIRYVKAQALLAYLAAEPGPHSRDRLADLLWPEDALNTGRERLRRMLFALRQSLGDAGSAIRVPNRDKVALDSGQVEVDITFLGAPDRLCQNTCVASRRNACIKLGEDIAALYRGPFLADFPSVSESFDQWAEIQREHARQRVLQVLERITACRESVGERADALGYARRRMTLDPWSESGCRTLMRLLAADGCPEAAMAEYERFRRLLAEDASALPSPETQALADSLRSEAAHKLLRGPTARRPLTVVACLFAPAGSGDQAYAATAQARENCLSAIRRAGGHASVAHGACVLGYFGYPRAHEHSSKAALNCALACAESQARVGVHSGWAVSDQTAGLPDPLGELTLAALRLALEADKGEAWASDRLPVPKQGALATLDACNGLPPVAAFLIPRNIQPPRDSTPLVDREEEMARLLAAWRAVRRDQGHAFLIRGEPGIGKSRLLRAMQERLPNVRWHTLRCLSERAHAALHPLADLAVGRPSLKDAGTAERNRRSGGEALMNIDQLGGADREIESSLDLFRRLADDGPLWVVVEDTHWADASTAKILRHLAASPPPGLLLVATSRHSLPEWPGQRMDLSPLSPEAADELVRAIAGDRLAPESLRQILARADGIPLFIEELVRLAETGQEDSLPASLRDLLASRLDILGANRQVIEYAATLGRRVSFALLHEVAGEDPSLALGEAIRLGLMTRKGDDFIFRHALIRDAAYLSQTCQSCQTAHLRAAQAMQRREVGGECGQPDLLAWHFAAAGRPREALHYHSLAGRQAMDRSAHLDAAHHFRAALAHLQALEDSDAPDELELQLLLGQTLATAHGFGSADARQAYERGRELVGPMDDSPPLFPLVWGLWLGSSSWWNFNVSEELARRLLRMAETSGDEVQKAHACYALGNTVFCLGRFAEAATYLEAASGLAEGDAALAYGGDPAVASLSFLSWAYWFLGRHDASLAASREALARARDRNHPHSLVFALVFAAILHRLRRSAILVRAHAEEALAVAGRFKLALWQAAAAILVGWSDSVDGHPEGLASMLAVADGVAGIMCGVKAIFLAQVLDACECCGLWQSALQCAEEGLAISELKADRHYVAEFRRVKGLALLRDGNREGEAWLEAALATARELKSPSLEVRALAALRQAGKPVACELAAALAAWEGGEDLADYREAAAG